MRVYEIRYGVAAWAFVVAVAVAVDCLKLLYVYFIAKNYAHLLFAITATTAAAAAADDGVVWTNNWLKNRNTDDNIISYRIIMLI